MVCPPLIPFANDSSKSFDDSREFKGFLVHIPKTGGMTLRPSFSSIGVGGHCTGHNTARKLREMLPNEWKRTPSFSFVRNPWDRAVSWFYSHGRIRDRRKPKNIEEVFSWFREWIIREGWRNHGAHHPTVREFLCDVDRREAVRLVDFVGKFEEYDICYRAMFEAMGVPVPEKVSRNVSGYRDVDGRPRYQDYYDTKTRYFIEGLCRWEINEFGYHFE